MSVAKKLICQSPTESTEPKIIAARLGNRSVTVEATRRAAFVREMGGSLTGYCDGYTDGFEQAIKWLLGNLADPLEVNYRHSAGMKHAKEYYRSHPRTRVKALRWFEGIGAEDEELSEPQPDSSQNPARQTPKSL